jgi:hypothetical protein
MVETQLISLELKAPVYLFVPFGFIYSFILEIVDINTLVLSGMKISEKTNTAKCLECVCCTAGLPYIQDKWVLSSTVSQLCPQVILPSGAIVLYVITFG